ncbi:MAG: translocation/assembly module TamB domain-containing protein [Myxococcaceae bacterium]|nr:translocation/assembly module TamB domain-containing protein [Myxococcaceae bacterium]
MVSGLGYLAGKTPEVVRITIAELVADLKLKQGIQLDFQDIAIEGFLTARVDHFRLIKEDIGLFVQAKSVSFRLAPLKYLIDGNPVSRIEIDTPEVMAKINFDQKRSKVALAHPPFSISELIIKRGRAEINLNGQMVRIVDLDTNLALTPRNVALNHLAIEFPELKIDAVGNVRYHHKQYPGLGSDVRIRVSGKLEEVPEIRRLNMPLNGEVGILGHLRYPSIERGFEFMGELKAMGIRIDDVKIASLKGLAFVNQERLELNNAKVEFAGTELGLAAQLKFDQNWQFSAQVNAQNASLYDLLEDLGIQKSWAELKFGTVGFVRGQVKPFFILEGHAKGLARDLKVQSPKANIFNTAYPIQYELDLGADREAFHFWNVRLRDGRTQARIDCDLFFNKKGIRLNADIPRLQLDSIHNRVASNTYHGSGSAHVSIQGLYQNLFIQSPFQMADFRFEGISLGNLSGDFQYQDNAIRISKVEAQKKSVRYTGDLKISLNGPTRVAADVQVHKGLVADLLELSVPGELTGKARFEGPLEKGSLSEISIQSDWVVAQGATQTLWSLNLLKGAGDFKIEQGVLDRSLLRIQIQNDRLTAKGFMTPSQAQTELSLDLYDTLQYRVRIHKPFGSLDAFLDLPPVLQRLEPKAGLKLSAAGSLQRPQDSRAELSLYPALFYLENLKMIASRPIEAHYDQGSLKLSEVQFSSAQGDRVTVKGTVDRTGPQIDLNVQADLGALAQLDDRIEGAYGDFKMDLAMAGTWKNPLLHGKASIAPDSYLSLRDYPPGLTHVGGEIQFMGDEAQIALAGQADQGLLQLAGKIDLAKRSFEDLRFILADVPVYYSTFLTGNANGYLRLGGLWTEPTLSGDLQFSDMLLTQELDSLSFRPTRSSLKRQSIPLDVNLGLKDVIRYESRTFNGELSGRLKLLGNTSSPSLEGELNVLSGEAYFRSHHFQIHKARASFDNPFRINPKIDVEASSQILDYDVTVRAQGDLAHPRLILSSKPSLAQNELMNLVLFGFVGRNYQDHLGVARSAGLEAISMASGLGDKFLKLMPEGSFDELRLGTLYNQMGGITPSVVLGMQVFGNLRLRLQTSLVQNNLGNREKRIELEKYMSRRWRWRLNWDSEGVTNWGDAGGDFRVRWDF